MAGVNQSRREFIQSLTAGAAAFSVAGFTGCANSGKRPNFVFILVDDMGWKDAGFMGSTFYDTPHMDRLASEGMVFTSAYANAPIVPPAGRVSSQECIHRDMGFIL